MDAIPIINKTREYLDYVERHILNVEKAWNLIKKECAYVHPIIDDFCYHNLEAEVKRHDISKLSEHEFIQYRKAFYRAEGEPKYDMTDAWEHHKANNPHHWENWTKLKETYPNERAVHCVHMVVDWVAMSYEFGGTAKEYYEKNRDKIEIPDWADKLVNEIFDIVYKDTES